MTVLKTFLSPHREWEGSGEEEIIEEAASEMTFMAVRCHFHFNDCKDESQRAAEVWVTTHSVRCWGNLG